MLKLIYKIKKGNKMENERRELSKILDRQFKYNSNKFGYKWVFGENTQSDKYPEELDIARMINLRSSELILLIGKVMREFNITIGEPIPQLNNNNEVLDKKTTMFYFIISVTIQYAFMTYIRDNNFQEEETKYIHKEDILDLWNSEILNAVTDFLMDIKSELISNGISNFLNRYPDNKIADYEGGIISLLLEDIRGITSSKTINGKFFNMKEIIFLNKALIIMLISLDIKK